MALFKQNKKKTKKITNVVLYTRVSTKDQILGYSLEKQEEDLKRFCTKENYSISNLFTDKGFSGKSTDKRTEYNKMLSYITLNNIDALIVWKLSRLTRNTKDLLELVEFLDSHGVALIALQDGIDTFNNNFSKMFITILGVIAEFEGENIVLQSSAGMIKKAESGAWMGGQIPFGYKKSDCESGLEINSEQAVIVEKIFTDYTVNAKSLSCILNELNLLNVKTNKGSKLSRSTLTFILKNPIYTGKYSWNVKNSDEKTFVSQHDEWKIIDNSLFDQAQVRLNLKSHKNIREDGKYLLSGLITCPICGDKLIADCGNGHNGERYEYYSCKNKIHKRYTIRKNETEKLVLNAVGHALIDDNFVEEINKFKFDNEVEELEKIIKLEKRQLSLIEDEILKAIDEKIKGNISDTNLKNFTTSRNAQIEELKNNIISHEKKLANAKSLENTVYSIDKILRNFHSIFTDDTLDSEEKNRLIHLIINDIGLDLSNDFKQKKITHIELLFSEKIVRLNNYWQSV